MNSDFFLKFLVKLKNEIKKIISYLYLVFYGVEVSYGACRLVGFPIISKVKGSRIIIENDVTIVSKTKGNIAGVNNRTIIATIKDGAIITLKYGSGVSGAKIVAAESITLGEYSGLGVNAVVYDTDFHPVDGYERRIQKSIADAKSKKIVIGKDVLIGANSIILKGTLVEDNVVVGAGSIVASQLLCRDSIYAGNPVKKVKSI